MFSTRQNKVSRLIQREMGDIFQKETLDLKKNTITTITKVRITADLKIARIYISVFPSGEANDTVVHINSIKNHIRYILGKRLRHQLKDIPEIDFFIDDSLDYIDNIENLLK